MGMCVAKAAAVAVLVGLSVGLTSCMSCSTKQDPDKLREKTAQTTANLKQDAKAIAQGIHEGWSRNHQLNLNTASKSDLATLPGITPRTADRIIENRPYARTEELVTKRVLSRVEFDKIADKVAVK